MGNCDVESEEEAKSSRENDGGGGNDGGRNGGGGEGGGSNGGGGARGGWGGGREGGVGGSGDGEQGAGGERGGDVAQAASTPMEAPLSVLCSQSSPWGTNGRVLQLQSSSPNPLHTPQPDSHTRMKRTSTRPEKILLPNERLPVLYSTVNVLRVVILNAFPFVMPEQFGATMTQSPGMTVLMSSASPPSSNRLRLARKLTRVLSSPRVRHAAPCEEHDTGCGGSGGGSSGGDGGGDGGSGAEGGNGGTLDAQAASKLTDTKFLCHSGSRARWRVVQVHLFDPVHVPQPVSQTFCTVKVRSLNAFAPMASEAPSYSIFSVARFDCAKPCFPTAAHPAVMVAQPPGMAVSPLYPF
eukprot:scaffold47759_cov45-Phaeocystis_antarctica.AAC.2